MVLESLTYYGRLHKFYSKFAMSENAICKLTSGAPAGFQARVGKIRREAPKNFFRLPTLVFSLPTLPYVTVAHPAHRAEADLREKASLATNQEGPLPSPPSDLALQLGLVIHRLGL